MEEGDTWEVPFFQCLDISLLLLISVPLLILVCERKAKKKSIFREPALCFGDCFAKETKKNVDSLVKEWSDFSDTVIVPD